MCSIIELFPLPHLSYLEIQDSKFNFLFINMWQLLHFFQNKCTYISNCRWKIPYTISEIKNKMYFILQFLYINTHLLIVQNEILVLVFLASVQLQQLVYAKTTFWGSGSSWAIIRFRVTYLNVIFLYAWLFYLALYRSFDAFSLNKLFSYIIY